MFSQPRIHGPSGNGLSTSEIPAYIIPAQFVLKKLCMPDRVTGIDDERFLCFPSRRQEPGDPFPELAAGKAMLSIGAVMLCMFPFSLIVVVSLLKYSKLHMYS